MRAEEFVVLFLGDSYTYGLYLDYEQTLPYAFERIARELDCGVPIRAVNAGWISASPLLGFRWLQEMGRAYRPDLVVYALDVTDFYDDLAYEQKLRRGNDLRVEPARVYVNSELEARDRQSRVKGLYYNSGVFESWFLEKLEESLDHAGHPLPRSPERRWALFERISEGSSQGCTQDTWKFSGVGDVSNPVLFEESMIEPLYPPSGRRQNAQIIIQALIYEDGSVGMTNIILDKSGNADFAIASRNAVSLWRYEPAQKGKCPFSVYFTVVVDYSIK